MNTVVSHSVFHEMLYIRNVLDESELFHSLVFSFTLSSGKIVKEVIVGPYEIRCIFFPKFRIFGNSVVKRVSF